MKQVFYLSLIIAAIFLLGSASAQESGKDFRTFEISYEDGTKAEVTVNNTNPKPHSNTLFSIPIFYLKVGNGFAGPVRLRGRRQTNCGLEANARGDARDQIRSRAGVHAFVQRAGRSCAGEKLRKVTASTILG